MPIFALTGEPVFPPPQLAEEDGLLAVGGDLRPERLLEAYRAGIFPWYSDGQPILWWSPDPRLVLFPGEFHRSRSLRKTGKRGIFEVRFDTAFTAVIAACARAPRSYGEGTWITRAMRSAYTRLHRLGYAHSVECWHDGALAGGLYGISLGSCFFGESMFAHMTDASKMALSALVDQAKRDGVLAEELPTDFIVTAIYARSCDPTLDYMKRGNSYTDEDIVRHMVHAFFAGVRRQPVAPATAD